MKYEVGAKVRIKKGLHAGNDYSIFVNSIMADYAGRIAEITKVYDDTYKIDLDGSLYSWRSDMFESVKECVVIYRKDREVIALDKSTGKTAMAKCHPTDKFDFAVGAKLAFDRLTGTTSEETTSAPKFKVGDRVTGNAKASKYYCLTCEGWKGYVTQEPDDSGHMRVSCDKTDIDGGYLVRIDCFELDDGPEYFNGKAICIECETSFLTKGKIYEFVDGKSIDDYGDRVPYCGSPIKSIDELNKNSIAKFVEVVE